MTHETPPVRRRRWLPYTAGGIAGGAVAVVVLAVTGVFAGGTPGRSPSGSAAATAARARYGPTLNGQGRGIWRNISVAPSRATFFMKFTSSCCFCSGPAAQKLCMIGVTPR